MQQPSSQAANLIANKLRMNRAATTEQGDAPNHVAVEENAKAESDPGSTNRRGRETVEQTRPLGTRIKESLHLDLATFRDRVNAQARKKGVKEYTQRELVEMALDSLLARDPETLS